jgi:hypothetical protein
MTPAEVSDNFRQEMAQALGDLKSDVPLIFDEIENISPPTAASRHWKDEADCVLFWQVLRSFFQRPPKYKLTFCFVGTNPSLLELPRVQDVENPVYLFAKPTFMPNLAYEETASMLIKLGFFMGLDFPHNVINRIQGLFGGHPFFIRQLCSQIHQLTDTRRPRRVTLEICKSAERETAARSETYVQDILASLRAFYPTELEMLGLLAADKTAEFHEFVAEHPPLVEHLIGYGLIRNDDGRYGFVFDAVRQVVQRGVKEASAPSLEEMRAEISRRRSRLEEGARSVLFFWARRLDQGEWEVACATCIPKLIAKQGPMTPQQVFSKGNSPLFVLDFLFFYKVSCLLVSVVWNVCFLVC